MILHEVKNMGVEKYSNLLNEEARDIFKALSNDKRVAIMMDLFTKPEGVTFSQLKEDLDLNQASLNNHLKKLFEGGLIINELIRKDDTREYSYYIPSKMGSAFFSKILEFVEEPVSVDHTSDNKEAANNQYTGQKTSCSQ